MLLGTIVTQCIHFSNRSILDVKKHSHITTGVLFWSPAGRWIVHHVTCPQSDLPSPKVTHPIRKNHFFLVANSQQHLTSTPKRKETNWSLPAPAPLYPYIMPPLHRLLGPSSFPQIALRGLSTVSELSRQLVRISEDQSSCRRRGSVMAPLRPAAHFDYLVRHNQPTTHRTGLMPCNFMRGLDIGTKKLSLQTLPTGPV